MLNTLISIAIIVFILLALSFTNSSEEIQFLNRSHTSVLKGIGTTLVLISHIGNSMGLGFLNPLGGLGVSLFLIIAGYGLNESFKKRSLENFFTKRLTGILIPYWIVVIFYWILNYEKLELSRFIGSFFLVYRLSLTWFVYYILGWYVIFYLVKKYLKNDYWFLIASIISILIIKETHIGEQAFSVTLGIFLSGNLKVRSLLEGRKGRSSIVFLILGISFSVLFFLLKIDGLDTPNNYLIFNVIQGIMKTSLAMCIIQFTTIFRNFFYSGLAWIGNLSFEIYLIHAQALSLLGDSLSSIILFFIVVCAVSIFVHLTSQKVRRTVLTS